MKKVALLLVFPMMFIGCESAGKKTAIGAGAGAAAGAAVGAIIGHQSGNRGKGALIGAALGAAAGGTIGNQLDKQEKELKRIAETKRTREGLITKLKGDILFKTGSTGINGKAKKMVSEISDIIVKYPQNRITIIGHTDSVGKDVHNQVLSKRRADSVKAVMVYRGVPSEHITTVGMGENEPIASNKSKKGRSKNRRVEIRIKMEEQVAQN